MIPPLKIAGMSGIAPKIAARSLPGMMAQIADNCKLFSTELDSWKAPLKVATASKGNAVSLFRMVNTDGSDVWLNWLVDVDAARGPIAGDTTQRTYYTGAGEPRVTNLALATSGGDFPFAWYVLGVYPPITAPSVSHSGGTGSAIARSFVYTFVTEWDEESQPSLPSAAYIGKIDGTWTVSGMDVAPLNSLSVTGASYASGKATLTVASTFGLRVGEVISVSSVTPTGYNGTGLVITDVASGSIKYAVVSNPGNYSSGGTINRTAPHHSTNMTKRLYWTEIVNGQEVFQFVAEIAVSLTSTTVAGSTIPDEPVPSTFYEMPPTDMIGIVEMPNGMMAGFHGNELCFCEPFKPHAWPSIYRLSTNRVIVGLGVSESSVIAATKGAPYVATGTSPDSMSMMKVTGEWPCTSKRGVVSMPGGVFYPSNDGLIQIGPTGAGVASAAVFDRTTFAPYVPSSIFASKFQGRYFGWYQADLTTVRGFIFDASANSSSLTATARFSADTTTLVPLSQRTNAVWNDPETGDLYICIDADICKWDADPNNNLNYDWLSKVFVMPAPINYGAAKVEADFANLPTPAQDASQASLDIAYNVAVFARADPYRASTRTHGSMNGHVMNKYAMNAGDMHGRGANVTSINTRFVTFQLYADQKLVFTKTITSKRPFRLPGGFRTTDIEVRISGNVRTRYAELAGTMNQLGTI
jgi:hypothetical protein